MKKTTNHQFIRIEGMTCTGCEKSIETAMRRVPGLKKVRARFASGTVEIVSEKPVPETVLKQIVEDAGYSYMGKSDKINPPRDYGWLAALAIGVLVFLLVKRTVGFDNIGRVSDSMGYLALFAVGLITSLHCVAMCGGINLSQCMKYRAAAPAQTSSKTTGTPRIAAFDVQTLVPSLLYNGGRVLSYTVIGGIVGGIGSVLSFSGAARGLVAVVAGVFMVLMGINLLGIFPGISRLIPRLPLFLRSKAGQAKSGKGPFIVGLLNGLMPCGPLQSMQLYAFGTGSVLQGALSMFFFSLGTVPLMLGIGILSHYMGNRLGRRMMQVGAVLVILLGFSMSMQGMALSGIAPGFMAGDFNANAADIEDTVDTAVLKTDGEIIDGVLMISSKIESGRYPKLTVQKGVPVKWTITANIEDITGCNYVMVIPEYGIQKELKPGDNIIEFTPTETGTIAYSCWMGMIRSTITVVGSGSESPRQDILLQLPDPSGTGTALPLDSCCQ